MSNEVAKLEGSQIVNPYAMSSEAAKSQGPSNSMTQTDSQRAMVEVMTSFEVAKRFPRDPAEAVNGILKECCRPSLAELAVYAYSRGGTDITGPSIRLMEAIARYWKNIQFGFRVLERRKDASSVQAFARDLETNTFIERTFDVRHWRDTKSGGYPIKEERDIYELIANMSQRRVRACILGLIPGDVVDTAVAQCEVTLQNSADTSAEGLAKLVAAFVKLGVNKAMIEGRIQCRLEAIKPVQFATLRKIFASLRDGMAAPDDFFDVSLADAPQTPAAVTGPDLKGEVEKTKAKKAAEPKGEPEPPAAQKQAEEKPKAEETAADHHEKLARLVESAIARAPDAGSLEGVFEEDYKDEIAKLYAGNRPIYDRVLKAYNDKINSFGGES